MCPALHRKSEKRNLSGVYDCWGRGIGISMNGSGEQKKGRRSEKNMASEPEAASYSDCLLVHGLHTSHIDFKVSAFL